jgi:hypothetical protein
MRDCPACDEKAEVREAKGGQSTLYCKSCGFQGFARTPKASGGLRDRAKGGGGEPPKPPPAGGGNPPAPPKPRGSFAAFLGDDE